MVALRLCLERLLPPRKERPIIFRLPKVEGIDDIPLALAAILEAVAQGEVTPGEGESLTAILEAYRKGMKLTEIEARLETLEKKVQKTF